MSHTSKPRFDVATALDLGSRPNQEDCVVADFSLGEAHGVGILADGMGGHSAGEQASAIVVGRILTELKMQRGVMTGESQAIPKVLKSAIDEANASMLDYMRANPETRGMGSTVVATTIVGDQSLLGIGRRFASLSLPGGSTQAAE